MTQETALFLATIGLASIATFWVYMPEDWKDALENHLRYMTRRFVSRRRIAEETKESPSEAKKRLRRIQVRVAFLEEEIEITSTKQRGLEPNDHGGRIKLDEKIRVLQMELEMVRETLEWLTENQKEETSEPTPLDLSEAERQDKRLSYLGNQKVQVEIEAEQARLAALSRNLQEEQEIADRNRYRKELAKIDNELSYLREKKRYFELEEQELLNELEGDDKCEELIALLAKIGPDEKLGAIRKLRAIMNESESHPEDEMAEEPDMQPVPLESMREITRQSQELLEIIDKKIAAAESPESTMVREEIPTKKEARKESEKSKHPEVKVRQSVLDSLTDLVMSFDRDIERANRRIKVKLDEAIDSANTLFEEMTKIQGGYANCLARLKDLEKEGAACRKSGDNRGLARVMHRRAGLESLRDEIEASLQPLKIKELRANHRIFRARIIVSRLQLIQSLVLCLPDSQDRSRVDELREALRAMEAYLDPHRVGGKDVDLAEKLHRLENKTLMAYINLAKILTDTFDSNNKTKLLWKLNPVLESFSSHRYYYEAETERWQKISDKAEKDARELAAAVAKERNSECRSMSEFCKQSEKVLGAVIERLSEKEALSEQA